jgi:hypothetical protein
MSELHFWLGTLLPLLSDHATHARHATHACVLSRSSEQICEGQG